MNLQAVDDDQVVLRSGAAHREFAFIVVDAGGPGKHLEHLEHVLEPAGELAGVRRLNGVGSRGAAGFAQPIRDVHALLESEWLGRALLVGSARGGRARRRPGDGQSLGQCPASNDDPSAARGFLEHQTVRREDLLGNFPRFARLRLGLDAKGRWHEIAAEDNAQVG
jgi:hypothetical protein